MAEVVASPAVGAEEEGEGDGRARKRVQKEKSEVNSDFSSNSMLRFLGFLSEFFFDVYGIAGDVLAALA